MGDPFGLTAAEVEGAGVTELVVYPRIDPIVALPVASGHDPQATARHPNALGRAGDDFYALRPYQVGDDLRRVHWPATAHHDELMIRQHELPWQERTTVLLDVRATAHVNESFELAVSAAASILNACSDRGDQVRLITTAGSDSGFEGAAATWRPASSTLRPSNPTRPPRCCAASTCWRGRRAAGRWCSWWPRWPPPTSEGSRTSGRASARSSPCSSSPRRGIRTASTRPRPT